jgi:hypothetical protein
MPSSRSNSKFRVMILWSITFLCIFLFILPDSAQAKKVFNPETGQGIRWLKDRVWQFGRGDGSVIAGNIRLLAGGSIDGH